MGRNLGETLTALKYNLQAAEEFSVAWDQFYDDVAGPHCRSPIGEPADNPRLERCLEAVAGRLYHQPEGLMVAANFSHVPEHGFWHGSGWVGGLAAICFYFEDIGVGLVGFLGSLSDEIHLARMNLVDQPAGANWNQMERVTRCN